MYSSHIAIIDFQRAIRLPFSVRPKCIFCFESVYALTLETIMPLVSI